MKKSIALAFLSFAFLQIDSQAIDKEEKSLGSDEHFRAGSPELETDKRMKEALEYFKCEKENKDVCIFSKKVNFAFFARSTLKQYPSETNESIVAHYIKYGAEHIIRSRKYNQNFNLVERLAFHPLLTKYFVGQRMDPESKRAVFFRNLIKPNKSIVKKEKKSKHCSKLKRHLNLGKKSKSTEKMEESQF